MKFGKTGSSYAGNGKTVEDIRLFRKAASHYEFKEMDQAEEIVNGLMERYPDAPGFLKFKCRFVTARAKQNRKFSKADEFWKSVCSFFLMMDIL